ncbi:MAG: hypothetical protein ALECFALPRED_000496 [Alectoria fallacina]|uniref:G-patch domain-containing protein n=1 Tax=Alectoria fallacina TaxID=1903189 RepID=A0A8H3JA17_9LECA|nr:MAG: hypothetical protein ALECFALPRED_000496 [Alectoria fallacina]
MAKIASPPLGPVEPAPEDLDDYMSMTIAEPPKSAEKETYTQRRIRKQRQADARSRPKSKAELAAAAHAARDDALSTALPSTSKGFQMMAKLGFKPGAALGASSNPNARTEPLNIAVKEDRGGVGMQSEKKRKFREEVEGVEKKQKAEEGGYRERVGREREEKRIEGLFWGAMRLLEGLELPEGGDEVPANKVNLLWRGLVRERQEKERERRARYDLARSLSRSAAYEDPEEDEYDRQALGKEVEEVEDEDEELDEFLGLEGEERLRTLVEYLRQEHRYCFWCKFRYEDEKMEGCPGWKEDDHD